MDFYCYQHPDRLAVAKIARMVQQHTPEGVRQITIYSPVCQECADQAQTIGTPLIPLTEDRP
jgi:hypothetical protein